MMSMYNTVYQYNLNVSVVDNDAKYFGVLVVCRAGAITVNVLWVSLGVFVWSQRIITRTSDTSDKTPSLHLHHDDLPSFCLRGFLRVSKHDRL